MASYRNISMDFWTDSKVVDDFTPEDRYIYLYCMTNPHTNLCGCYEVSIKQIANETGYNNDTVERLLKRLDSAHNVIRYSAQTKELLILNWCRYNWSTSEKLNKPLLGEIRKVKNDRFREYLAARYNERSTVTAQYNAAEDDRRTARHVARVLAHVFVNLQRKLTRRREDERTDGALFALALCQALDDRHRERTGLARTGLGAAHQVAALEHRRDRLLLNGRRLGIARLLQCLEDVFLQLEFVKFHGKYSIPFAIFGMQSGKSRLPADWVLCYTYCNCL